MPTTRNQKKARKSTETDMWSDIENLYVMLGGNYLEREETETSNFGRRPDSPCYDSSLNQNINSHSNPREAEFKTCALNGQSLRETDSNSEFSRLS